jgi:hypothetical protein
LRHPYFLLGGDQAAAVLSKLRSSRKWRAWWQCEYYYYLSFLLILLFFQIYL